MSSSVMPVEPAVEVDDLFPNKKMIENVKGPVPEAFQRFINSAEKAEVAFKALAKRVQELKVELDTTNKELRLKIDELDRLTGHLTCLLESLSDGVVVMDKSGAIRFFNPAAEKISGRKAFEMVGTRLDAWLSKDSALLGRVKDIQDLATAGTTSATRCQIEILRIDGTAVPLAAGVAPVKDKSGQILGVVIVLADLTEWAELQKRLQHVEALAEMGRMSAVLAHEVRNPLSGIEGFAGLLQRDLKSMPEKRRYADMIAEGARDLNNLVESLLQFARVPSLQLQEVNLRFILDEMGPLALSGIKNATANLEYEVVVLTDKSSLLADRISLRQVFLNLIRNAFESLQPRGHGKVTVTIEQDTVEGFDAFKVSVADNGDGIPEKIRGTLFKPFVTTKTQGTGLGLPMVAKLVAAHGGSVKYEDAPGGGACFQVLLPMKARA